MSESPWLDLMVADLGTHEIAGPKANPKIVRFYADVGHPECKSDEIAWCAAFTGSALVRAGLPIPPKDVCLMARSYCTYGVACEPREGAIMVLPRGNSSWQGHVGVVVKVNKRTVDYIAGNQSDQVGYGKANIEDALAFRWPVAATVPALRQAGSTEVKKADSIQTGGILVTALPAVVAVAKETMVPTAPPVFNSLPEALGFWQQVLGGMHAVVELVLAHPWLAGTTALGLLCLWVGHTLKAARVAKAAAGAPLSSQLAAAAAPAGGS